MGLQLKVGAHAQTRKQHTLTHASTHTHVRVCTHHLHHVYL